MHNLKSWYLLRRQQGLSIALKRRQENRAEKRMDAPICQGFEPPGSTLPGVYNRLPARTSRAGLRQFGLSSHIAETGSQL
jgi:hypothetical protein